MVVSIVRGNVLQQTVLPCYYPVIALTAMHRISEKDYEEQFTKSINKQMCGIISDLIFEQNVTKVYKTYSIN